MSIIRATKKGLDAIALLRIIARKIESGNGYAEELKSLIPLIDPEQAIVRLLSRPKLNE
jgi:hypothetical protein